MTDTMPEASTVAIEAGQPCFKCGEPVVSQEDKPVMFWCADCDIDHVWHGDCLPPHLREILEQHSVKRAE